MSDKELTKLMFYLSRVHKQNKREAYLWKDETGIGLGHEVVKLPGGQVTAFC